MALSEAFTGGAHDTLEEARQYLQAHVVFLQEYALMAPHMGRRVLDVGCSSGHFGGLLRECGHKVTGIDRSITRRAERRLDATLPVDVTRRQHWRPVPQHDTALARLLLRHIEPEQRVEVVRQMSGVARTVLLGVAGPVRIEGLEGAAAKVLEAIDARLVDAPALLDAARMRGVHLGTASWTASDREERAAFRTLLRPLSVVAEQLGLGPEEVSADLDRWLAEGGSATLHIEHHKGVRA